MFAILAIVDAERPFGVIVNGLAHACIGMGARIRGDAGTSGQPVRDAQVLVVKCTQAQLRKSRADALERGLTLVDFTQTMTGDTYVEQLQKTKECAPESLEYYAVVIAGDQEELAAVQPA